MFFSLTFSVTSLSILSLTLKMPFQVNYFVHFSSKLLFFPCSRILPSAQTSKSKAEEPWELKQKNDCACTFHFYVCRFISWVIVEFFMKLFFSWPHKSSSLSSFSSAFNWWKKQVRGGEKASSSITTMHACDQGQGAINNKHLFWSCFVGYSRQ